MGSQLPIQRLLNGFQPVMGSAAGAVLGTGALKVRLHAGDDQSIFPHGLHEVVESSLGQLLSEAAAPLDPPADLDEARLLQLLQDLIGKLLGDPLGPADVPGGELFPIRQGPQDAQGVVGLSGDQQENSPFLLDDFILSIWTSIVKYNKGLFVRIYDFHKKLWPNLWKMFGFPLAKRLDVYAQPVWGKIGPFLFHHFLAHF